MSKLDATGLQTDNSNTNNRPHKLSMRDAVGVKIVNQPGRIKCHLRDAVGVETENSQAAYNVTCGTR